MIYDKATRSDSHFNHLPVFSLPNEMDGSQTRLLVISIVVACLLNASLRDLGGNAPVEKRTGLKLELTPFKS